MAPGELQPVINGKTVHWVQSRGDRGPGQGPRPGGSRGRVLAGEAGASLSRKVARLYLSNLDGHLTHALFIFCWAGDNCLNYYFNNKHYYF